jgi:hypothetical protein
MSNLYQISGDKYAVTWPIAIVNFADGGQIRMRAPNGYKPEDSALVGKRKVRNVEYSQVEKTGSLEACEKQQ